MPASTDPATMNIPSLLTVTVFHNVLMDVDCRIQVDPLSEDT
jgi:hypothetical protein